MAPKALHLQLGRAQLLPQLRRLLHDVGEVPRLAQQRHLGPHRGRREAPDLTRHHALERKSPPAGRAKRKSPARPPHSNTCPFLKKASPHCSRRDLSGGCDILKEILFHAIPVGSPLGPRSQRESLFGLFRPHHGLSNPFQSCTSKNAEPHTATRHRDRPVGQLERLRRLSKPPRPLPGPPPSIASPLESCVNFNLTGGNGRNREFRAFSSLSFASHDSWSSSLRWRAMTHSETHSV